MTLVSSAPEVQWVALRNINLILQKRPQALSNEMRVFFCKYNDPPYVKVEKLEIMIKLVEEKNVDTFLSELKESVSPVLPLFLFPTSFLAPYPLIPFNPPSPA